MIRAAAIGAGTLLVVALVVVAFTASESQPTATTPSVANPAPSPIISTPAATAPTAADRTPDPTAPVQARRAARRFLTGYLALLYGRRPADQVTDITPAVRRQLADLGRVPAAQRMRRPEVVDLKATVQAPGVVIVTASIDDGDLAVYPLVFTVEQQAGRWRVADLADH